MNELLDRFLSARKSTHTQKAYRIDVSKFLISFNMHEMSYLGFQTLPTELLSQRIETYLNATRNVDVHSGRTRNVQTYNRKRHALSSFFNYLIDWYEYPKNLVRQFSPLPTRKKSNTQSLTREEVTLIKSHLHEKSLNHPTETNHRNELIVEFLAHYALRRCELVSLRWSDFHPLRGVFEVTQKGHVIKEKPLLPDHWKRLLDFRGRFGQENAQPKCPYVFHAVRPHPKTKAYQPLSAGYVFQMVKATAAHVVPEKHITPHSFRASFVGLALDANVDPAKIAAATGHAELQMIYYYDTRDTKNDTAIHCVARSIL